MKGLQFVTIGLAVTLAICIGGALGLLTLDKSTVVFPVATELRPGWSLIEPSAQPISEPIEFRILLKQRNLDVLEDIFWRVSDPSHEDYQQYLTTEQVLDLIAPPKEEQEEVKKWLIDGGARKVETFGDFIKAEALPHVLERIFKTTIKWVRDDLYGEKARSEPKMMGGYWLPRKIARLVRQELPIPTLTQLIHKSRFFHPISRDAAYGGYSDDLVVPETVRNLYNISSSWVISTTSSVNVGEFTTNSFSESDLAMFVQGCNLMTPNKIKTVGPYNPQNPDEECSLDIQWITAIAQNSTNQYTTSTHWLLEFAQELFVQPHAPLVTSISWGSDERQEGQSYNNQVDTEWQKLGVKGQTILASSGDSGAEGVSCESGNFTFNPIYPTTSPYVVSVGATMLQTATNYGNGAPPVCQNAPYGMTCASNGIENPADDPQGGFATGGGFSVYEPRPSFQVPFIEYYMNDSSIPKPPLSDFNPNNRGFPDVAANGQSILIAQEGKFAVVGGTSASAPIWGGIIALMNDRLLASGHSSIGYANPLLYSMVQNSPSTFRTIGGLGTNNKDGCQYGYVSNPNPPPHSWDPVTGLGTPNVANIMDYIHQDVIVRLDENRRRRNSKNN